jgi:hypothetical protein
MGEIYQVIFNTRGSNVINNTNLNAVQFNVNWASILPDKYKRFRCQFSFKSVRATSALVDLGYVNIDLGGSINIYDGLTMSSNIGVIYPEYLTTTSGYFTASTADNIDFFINYPTNTSPTITLKTFAGVNMASM